MKDFVIFDLDGTLFDTAEGIKVAINHVLKKYKYNFRISKKETIKCIGKGVYHLLSTALRIKDIPDEQMKDYLYFYEKYQYVSKPYKHVMSTLKYLNKNNVKVIIYSNKPQAILDKLVERKLDKIKFEFVIGERKNVEPKPNVTYLTSVLKKHKLLNKKGIYVGDSISDLLAGRNLNMETFIFKDRYNDLDELIKNNPDHLIKDIKEILPCIREGK